MKRRTFISTLAALAATPALPAASLAAPGPVAAQHFALAKLLARAHNHCTRDMLARHLKVSPEMATKVQALLLERGVITPPVAGVSMAINPMNTNCIPNEALKPTNVVQKAADVRARVKDLMERHAERMQQVSDIAEEPSDVQSSASDAAEADAALETPPEPSKHTKS